MVIAKAIKSKLTLERKNYYFTFYINYCNMINNFSLKIITKEIFDYFKGI